MGAVLETELGQLGQLGVAGAPAVAAGAAPPAVAAAAVAVLGSVSIVHQLLSRWLLAAGFRRGAEHLRVVALRPKISCERQGQMMRAAASMLLAASSRRAMGQSLWLWKQRPALAVGSSTPEGDWQQPAAWHAMIESDAQT